MIEDAPPSALPLIQPLGDSGLLVRFASTLSDTANRAAVDFARRLMADLPAGVDDVDANLVSVLLTYDPAKVRFDDLAGEVRVLLATASGDAPARTRHSIPIVFGGEDGPDLEVVAASLGISEAAFIERHCSRSLRVLATGFAPGFVYCGFHPENLAIPRRTEVRRSVPPGTVLFAARQTAITATSIPTGWHVIGRTAFRNFVPDRDPPTQLREGDEIVFEVAT